jgi:hypothetical protein
VTRRHWQMRPTLFALFVTTLLPSLAGEAAGAAGEVQTPDTRNVLGAISDSSDAARAQTLSRVIAAWRARQDQVKSFHFAWDSRITLPKGYAFPTYYDNPVVGGLIDQGAQIGDQNVEITIPQSEFWVMGQGRLRDEFFEVAYKGAKDWPKKSRVRNIIDGNVISRLMTPVALGEVPVISIWRQEEIKNLAAFKLGRLYRPDARTNEWAPLCLAFRRLDPTLGWPSPENCGIVGENVLVDGARCIKIRMDGFEHSEMCWVDPSRDDIIVQWEKRIGRGHPISVAIEYRRDKEHGWIPSRWKRQLPGTKAGIDGAIESTVTHYTINEKLPDDAFAHSSPPGTRVCDVTADGLIAANLSAKSASGKQPGGKQPDAKESGPAAPTMEAIVAAWTRRQAKTKSLKFTWREERQSSALGPAQERQTAEGPHTVLIDGERFAYVADNNPYPPQIASALIEQENKAQAGGRRSLLRRVPTVSFPPARIAFDGTTTRTYRALNHATITGIGSTKSGFSIAEAQDPALEPVLLMFRPLEANLGRIRPADYSVSPNRGKIGAATYAVIETSEEGPARIRTSYWLDPTRDYIVLRKQQTRNQRDFERTDISYRNDPIYSWLPDRSYASTVDRSGRAWRTSTTTITDFAINQPIPPAEFLAEFPKGTKIHDIPNTSAGGGGIVLRTGPRSPGVTRPIRVRKRSELQFKPLFDRFANAAADVEAALKTAKDRQKRVLILFGNNTLPGSLQLYTILKEDAEAAPVVKVGFVLVLVDIYTDAGRNVLERYFQVPQPIITAHVGILDPSGENLQFQELDWLRGESDFDAHKIKRLLSYWLTGNQHSEQQ